ncbi:MAG: small subunit ribosomal protein [Thermomicrobiales bacterium]|nr:small subunit ribosomal protein [Thermomicrobiales bacterium]MEA2531668.1 small subunit ribosomal protein [Thermomicrobiales bacterium]
MRGSPRDARNYELMTVFSPDVPEDEIQGTIDRVVGYITTATGAMVDVNRDSPWGRRRLAYPIRHASRDVRDGFYTLYHFQVAPHRVEDIERELKLNDRVIRYLLTLYTPRPVEEQAPPTEESAQTTPAGTEDEVPTSTGEPTEASEPSGDGEPVEASASAAEPAEEPETVAATEPEPASDVVEGAGALETGDGEAGAAEAAPPKEA